MNYCLNCGKEIKNQNKFCCSQCSADYRSNELIKEWQAGERTGISGEYKIADYVRKYMLKKANYQCEICGWGKINPYTNKYPLKIHHIDGDYTHNTEDNLQVLCPNCHSLTATFKGSNTSSGKGRAGEQKYHPRAKKENFCIDCGCKITFGAVRCRSCANKYRKTENQLPVSREELKNLIRTTSFVQIGKQFNLTDNGIRKWCKHYNLPTKKTEINNYSNEEWDKI